MSEGSDVAFNLIDLDLTSGGSLEETGRGRAVVRLGELVLGTLNIPGRDERPTRDRAVRRNARRLFAELALPPIPAPTDWPSATVIVCTRDRPDNLRACLAAIARLDYPDLEVIVVDNAPTDGASRAVVEHAGVRYVLEQRAGLDNARNSGLAAATGDVVAYTDDDALPEPGWLRALVLAFESPSVAASAGLVIPSELDTPAQRLFENVYRGMGKGYDQRLLGGRNHRHALRPEHVGTGCNMAFRRSVLVELGGFDPALDVGTETGGGGDLDAFVRVMERGGVIAYRPDAVVRHRHRRTLPELRKQLYDNGSGYSAMLAAAYQRADGPQRRAIVRRYCSWIVRWQLLRIARRLLRRERLPMRLLVAELHGACVGPRAYARARAAAARGGAGE